MPNIRRLGLHNACKHRPRNVHAFGQHLSIRCKGKSELLDLCVEGCFFHRTQPDGRKKTPAHLNQRQSITPRFNPVSPKGGDILIFCYIFLRVAIDLRDAQPRCSEEAGRE